MSEIAGCLAAHAGAYFAQAPLGGPGLLIGGVTLDVQSQTIVVTRVLPRGRAYRD